ncbi:MAG: glucokinase [Devosia sp.]|nr:glucokinase [Devosia sp.]
MNENSRQALVGAIGGTYISLALTDIDELSVSNFALLSSGDFSNPMQAIERYLKSVPRCPDKVALAVAGTVHDTKAHMHHRPWTFTRNDIRAVTGAEHVMMVNDTEALALALPRLTEYDLVEVVEGERVLHGTKAVIGSGTGLGIAGLVWTGERWLPVAGEGRFVSLPALRSGDFDVRAAIDGDGIVSLEQLLSGRGLVAVNQALRQHRGLPEAKMTAPQITTAGLSGEDPVAREALDLMGEWFGRVAGDVALLFGARGGIYLAGGLAANIIPVLHTPRFREAYAGAGGGRGAYLDRIGVHVIKMGADAGIKGATVALGQILPTRPIAGRHTVSR